MAVVGGSRPLTDASSLLHLPPGIVRDPPFLIFAFQVHWLKQEFLQNKIKMQRIVMCSSTSFQLIGDELIQLKKEQKRMTDEQFHQANNK